MTDRNLVGRCGLYCGACGIYRAYKDNGRLLKGLAERFKCPPEKVRCEGCMALTPDSWGYECEIVKCLRGKSLDFCYQCAEYRNDSCEKFRNLAQGYLENAVDLRANLARIENGETEEWLRESEEKFKCPACRKPVPVYGTGGKCHQCGAQLAKKA